MMFERIRMTDPAGVQFRITLNDQEDPDRAMQTVEIWMEALEFHLHKARDYQGAEQELGPLAQFVDMNRKWVKIKHALWFGRHLTGPEKVPEILFDLMAHIGLTLRMIQHPGNQPWARDFSTSDPNFRWPTLPDDDEF
jgi:hypothetical protein